MTRQKMLGYVNWAPNHQSCYVRVNIPDRTTGIPLAIKATFPDFHWRDFKKGDAVEVEWPHPTFAPRRFKIVGLLKAVKPIERKDETMAMSKERVRFYIRDTYFTTQVKRMQIAGVMAKAFGISEIKAASWLLGCGVWLTCRPSQFARFLIYRNDANIVNGFMDLRAELMRGPVPDVYDMLAKKAGVTRREAKLVSLALSFDADDVEATQDGRFGGDLDVSEN